MNMERRLKKLSGLQPVYIDVNSNPTPQVSPIEEVVQEVNHNKVEVFIMADTRTHAPHRAVGVDIGTGFISCAELEKGKV